MGKTGIPYLSKTWNPCTGCAPDEHNLVCRDRCWAARTAKRFPRIFGGDFRPRFHPDRLEEPLHWRKAQVVGVCMMGDLFHDEVQIQWLGRVWRIMERTPRHIYLLLTKRPHNARWHLDGGTLLANVWIGVTAFDQESWDRNVAILCDTPAAHRWISLEPLLGPVDIGKNPGVDWIVSGAESGPGRRPAPWTWFEAIDQRWRGVTGGRHYCKQYAQFPDGTGEVIRREPGPGDTPWQEILERRR